MISTINVKNLSKNYFEKKAVKNINFKIEENEIVGLLGPNGCGKTTTIAMILGLLRPTTGQVLINDMDIEKMSLSGWGKNFDIFSNVYNPKNNDDLQYKQ